MASGTMYAIQEDSRQCDTCSQIFMTTLEFLIHSRKHRGNDKNFECQICKAKFELEEKLKDHRKINHPKEDRGQNFSKPQKQYKCDLCGKFFTTFSYVALHIKNHISQKSYFCTRCKKSFERYDHFQRHIASQHNHTKEQKVFAQFECNICGYAFVSWYYLNRHMQKHTATKQYKCDVCGREYFHENSLTKHVRAVHSTQAEATWKHLCIVCGRKFYESFGLKRHMTIHTGDREALCSICGREFTRLTSLVRHIGRKHPHLTIKAETESMERPHDNTCPVTIVKEEQVLFER